VALVAAKLEVANGRDRAEVADAAARHDAFLGGRARRVKRVLDASLLLFHLRLGDRADVQHGDAARELRQALLELLAVVVRGRRLDLVPDLRDAGVDVGLLAGALHDRRVFLVDDDRLRLAEVVQREALELDAEILGDAAAAGDDRDVLEHGLAAIAEARRLDGAGLEHAAQLVDDERGERLGLDVLGDDEQRATRLRAALEHGQELAKVRDLLLVDEDVGLLELRLHRLGARDEVGRDVALVELHAFDQLERGLGRLRFLDRDDAVLADLVHRLGEELADRAVVVGRDRRDLLDLLVLLHGARELLDLSDRRLDRLVDAALERHGVHAGRERLQALVEDGLGEHGGGRRPVARDVARLAGDLVHELGAHVLERIRKLDFLRHRDAVLGHDGGAEAALKDDLLAGRAERHLHGSGELFHAALNAAASVLVEQ
jgi:hypothetical protein